MHPHFSSRNHPSVIRFLLVMMFAVQYNPASSQTQKFNPALKAQLDSSAKADQYYRTTAVYITKSQEDSLALFYKIPADSVYNYLMARQDTLDRQCLRAITAIIKKYGYPGKHLVDAPTSEVAFFVIQHSDKIPDYLPLLKATARKGELRFVLVAMMEDRWLMEEGKEQIYGTQVWANTMTKDSVSGVSKPDYYFYPIKDVAHINQRRKAAGFQSTIEEYAVEMGIPFRIKRANE